MPPPIYESTLELPTETVQKLSGVGLDIGGSLMKIVYRPKQKIEKEVDANGKTSVKLTYIVVEDKDELIPFLEEHADVTTNNGGTITTVCTTGIGISNHWQAIEQTLHVKLKNLSEFECFCETFCYLAKSIPREDLFISPPQQILRGTIKRALELASCLRLDGVSLDEREKVGEEEEEQRVVAASHLYSQPPQDDIFPCMLVQAGSGMAFLKVEESGKYELLEVSNRGGRMFIGLGALLTGKKTFDEIIELAAKGNADNIDFLMKDIGQFMDNDDYGTIPGWTLLYCFGKGSRMDRDAFKPEDLAASLLRLLVVDLVQMAALSANAAGAKHVCFAGSFVQNEVVRNAMTMSYVAKSMLMPKHRKVQFHIVKNGGLLGALGAFLSGKTS